MNQPHILSLAWKYHPAITSGVGVACEGLNNALSMLASVTVIYPNVSKVVRQKEVLVSGESLSEQQKQTIFRDYCSDTRTSYELPVLLDPYFVSSGKLCLEPHLESNTESSVKGTKPENHKSKECFESLLYDDIDVFGENVREKIFLYNRLVDEVADGLYFDIIHAHDWMTYLAGIQLKERYHKPLILHVHSLEYDRVGHKDVSWVYGVERYAMSKADMVIAASEYTKGIIEDSYGLSSHHIHVVHNAVTPPAHNGSKIKSENGKFRVLFAGRIDGAKGIEYFIKIAIQAIKRSKNFEFFVAGKGLDGLKFETIDGYKEVTPYIHFLGHLEREALFTLYHSCDALCMPAISEPFGLTAIEAASVGLPVILSTKTGAAEILVDTPVADFWDIAKYAEYLVALKDDHKFREKVVRKNFAAVQNLSWDKAASSVMNLYRMLI